MALQQSKLLLFEAWSIWRKSTWQRAQQRYSLEIQEMKEKLKRQRSADSANNVTPGFGADFGSTLVSPSVKEVLHTAAPDMSIAHHDVQTFVIHSPQRYRGGEGLLNKLLEAQLFIQQAVAENTALRNFVHILRAMHSWRLSVDALCRKKGMLRRVARKWTAGVLFKVFEQWVWLTGEARRQAGVLLKVVLRWRKRMLWAALDMWKAAVADLVRLIIIAHRIIGKMHNRLLSSALSRWLEWTGEHKKVLTAGERILGRWRKRVEARVWSCWWWRVEGRARLADIATRIILRWQMAQVYPYLEVYALCALHRRSRRPHARCARLLHTKTSLSAHALLMS